MTSLFFLPLSPNTHINMHTLLNYHQCWRRKKRNTSSLLEKRVFFSVLFNGIIKDIFNISCIFKNIKLTVRFEHLRTCPYLGPYDFNEWMEFLGYQDVDKPLECWWEEDWGFTAGFVTKSRRRWLFHTQKCTPLLISILVRLLRQ